MNRLRFALLLMGTAPLLQSCATTPGTPLAMRVEPVMTVRHATDNPDGYYQLGKYFQGQDRFDQAIDSYLKALSADPQHVEAHNALGTVYAAQRRFDLAVASFQAALALAPKAAHVQNNLGYAYFLEGRYQEAVAAFEAATALEPANRRTWNNLGMALARAGDQNRSKEAFSQAAALVEHTGASTDHASAAGASQATGEATHAQARTLAVPKDRGVIAPLPVASATNEVVVAAVSDAVDPAVSSTEDGRKVAPAPELASAAQPLAQPQSLALSVAEGAGYSIKLVPEVAQIEVHQLAPQVFELRTSEAAPSLPTPSLTADLPTRFRELQELSASAGHIEVAIADDIKPSAHSGSQTAAMALVASASQRQATRVPHAHGRVLAASVAGSGRPLKSGDFYASVEAARTPRRPMRFFRLELANGIGIKGFARRMNEMLVANGAPTSVLSDHRPFRQVRTEIQYRDGYASAANALGRRMAVRPAVVKSEGLPLRTDVRIVLGRDLVHKFALRDGASSEWLLSDAALRAVLAEVFSKS